jgi:hypothetical protein
MTEAITHQHLLTIVKTLPGDHAPWGQVKRWSDPAQAYPDCSCGCRWALWGEGPLGMDWCICTNPASHRAGLLTFEHQACQVFEPEDAGQSAGADTPEYDGEGAGGAKPR